MPQTEQRVHELQVDVYRTDDRLIVAAPKPGPEPTDIAVELTAEGRLASVT